ncbi:MAG: hypothetical protein ACFFCS_11035 [Candidatus Hodarchaeota archaeon]
MVSTIHIGDKNFLPETHQVEEVMRLLDKHGVSKFNYPSTVEMKEIWKEFEGDAIYIEKHDRDERECLVITQRKKAKRVWCSLGIGNQAFSCFWQLLRFKTDEYIRSIDISIPFKMEYEAGEYSNYPPYGYIGLLKERRVPDQHVFYIWESSRGFHDRKEKDDLIRDLEDLFGLKVILTYKYSDNDNLYLYL